MVEDHYVKPIISMITLQYIERICNNNNLVLRRRTGNLTRSSQHTEWAHRLKSFHLDQIHRKFIGRHFNENLVENVDETHLYCDITDSVVLRKLGSKQVKYNEVVSGNICMTLLLRPSGEIQAKIYDPFFIFENLPSNYLLQGCPDNVHGRL